MNKFLNELKRRNIFRVAGVYAVVGWLLIQMGIALETSLDMPGWFDKLITILVLVGFPLAMVLAWAFEMTPDGVKRTESVDPDESITDRTGRKLDFAILGGLGLVAALVVFQISRPSAPETQLATNDGQSIAVLPFVNMSSDKEQEYFADGISEEILNVLVRIPDLKVAGRTSSFSFKDKNEDLRMIGETLDVNHILEGSVRRSGAKLRITAQLIRSDDGFHLWSDSYDREIADIFDIQDEIAKEVANELAISLGLEVQHKPFERTTDILVYENYLKARQLFLERGRKNLDEALALLNEATSRDPDYAPAWSLIGNIYTVYQSYATEEEYEANNKQWNEVGKEASLKALSLDPKSAEALANLGVPYFYEFNFVKAYEYFDKALSQAPKNPVVLDVLAQSGLDVGYLEEAEAHIAKAVAIDPLVGAYRNIKGWSHLSQGEFDTAYQNFTKSIELNPKLPHAHFNKMSLYFNSDRIDQFPALLNQAVDAGVFQAGELENWRSILGFIENRSTMSDEEALQRYREHPGPKLPFFATTYSSNADEWIKINQEMNWSYEHRSLPELFRQIVPGVYADERWKQQVRDDGILALWQSRGFPAHCRPLKDDDFECDDHGSTWTK